MLGLASREDEIRRVFGVETPDVDCSDIRRWQRLYRGGGLRLAAAVASELARLTVNELKVGVRGSKRAEFLEENIKPLMPSLRRGVERGLAEGSLIFKPYVEGERIRIDTVSPDCFIPIAWDGERCTAAVFCQETVKEDVFYTRLEYHRLERGRYRIENAAYRSKNRGSLGRPVPLSEVDEWADMAESVVIENVERPLFGFFRTPVADTDGETVMGVSVFARAEEQIAQADELYENLLWEFRSGKRRLYVDITAFERDSEGRPRLPDTELYRAVDLENGFFSEWSPELRYEAFRAGLNEVLRRIEFNCSLAYGTLSEPDYVEKTAEEVRAGRQRSYSFVCELQSQLRAALEDLIYAMDVWAGVCSLAPTGKYECAFEFDDGYAADRRAEYEEKLRLVELGIMRPWEMRAWYFGEDENAAKAAVAEAGALICG